MLSIEMEERPTYRQTSANFVKCRFVGCNITGSWGRYEKDTGNKMGECSHKVQFEDCVFENCSLCLYVGDDFIDDGKLASVEKHMKGCHGLVILPKLKSRRRTKDIAEKVGGLHIVGLNDLLEHADRRGNLQDTFLGDVGTMVSCGLMAMMKLQSLESGS